MQSEAANQKKWWSTKLLNHDKELDILIQKHNEEINIINDTKNDLKDKIVELSKRLHDY